MTDGAAPLPRLPAERLRDLAEQARTVVRQVEDRLHLPAPALTILETAVALVFAVRFTGADSRQTLGGMATTVLAVLLLVRARPIMLGLLRAWPWLALAVWAVASRWWSIQPGVVDYTSRTAIDLLLTVLFGAYLAGRFRTDDLLRLLGVAYAVASVLSAFRMWRDPALHTGRWSGAFAHPNYFGHAAALGALTALLLVRRSRPWTFLWLPVAVLHLVLLRGSQSQGAYGALAAGLAAAVVIRAHRHVQRLVPLPSWAWWTGAAGAGVAVVALHRPVLEALGQDPTLTGRTQLWHGIWPYVTQRPLVGYGFWAMWTGARGYAAKIASSWPYGLVPHAHDVYLEVLVGLGAVGLVLFLAGVLFAWRVAGERASASGGRDVWPGAFVVFALVAGVTESVHVLPPTTVLAFLVALAASTRRERGRPA